LGDPEEEWTIGQVAEAVLGWFGVDAEVVPGELPKGSPTRRKPDVDKMWALGYEPVWHLVDGLDTTLDWYASNR
jgi:nucleoside-diphosphate-sugar epimerase